MATLLAMLLALAAAPPGEVPQPVHWTVAGHAGGGGRVPFVRDRVLLEVARDPEFGLDYAVEIDADANGRVENDLLRNGWAYCPYESDRARTVIVTGRGFHSIFVNGDRFVGDFYRLGLLRLAVPLRKGWNHLLVRSVRGEFTIRFEPAAGSCSLSPRDATLPDLREGERIRGPGAVVVLNHTAEPLRGASLRVGGGSVFAPVVVPIDPVLPYGLAKPSFPLTQLRDPEASELDEKGRYLLPVTLLRGGEVQEAAAYPVPVRGPLDAYVETRVSGIDGSVQYYAVRPPVRVEPGKRYALYLSLHGAGVRAWNQARAYRSKRDAFVVAPTNRRRFGFDWQDWGRLDALEALEFALARYPIDPARVYLTGHSMGGHGTWYLGALYPSRFAAVCPSAGWESFFTYGGGMPRSFGESAPLRAFTGVLHENDTGALLGNLAGTPMFVLHGGEDDNVPVSESHRLVARLRELHHPDFVYHEEPGAGHWWGDECVDYVPLFEFCRRHVRVEKPLRFRFATFDPAVTASYAWATVVRLADPARLGSVEVSADPRRGRVVVTTENVAALALDLRGVVPAEETRLDLDGGEMLVATAEQRFFRRADGTWEPLRDAEPGAKGPARGGPFKLAWRNRMVWVYGTSGTPEENAAVLAKVRYDATVWWYRANGSPRIVPDREFDADAFAGRNVILYGNADTNSAFRAVLGEVPVSVGRGRVRIGSEVREGDLGLFLVYPRKGSDSALVGVVGATTPLVMRMGMQARYFVSGTAFPDWTVWTPETLRKGMEGVEAAGTFGPRWRLPR